jgi:membrane protein YdbS with pleckstrin-like domain
MNISMSKTRGKYPLSTAKIVKKTIMTSLYVLFFAVVGTFYLVNYVYPNLIISSFSIGALLFAAGIAILYWYQYWYFATYYYDLTDQFLIIKKGPIASSEITIPYNKINDVYVEQDILDRFFGLYDVHVSTATTISGQTAHIDGVNRKAAEGLRKEILGRISSR